MMNRTQGDRRWVNRDRWTEREARLARLFAGTGAHLIGVQTGVPECGLSDLVLFSDDFGRSFTVPVAELTSTVVRERLARRWGSSYARQFFTSAVASSTGRRAPV